MPTSRTTWQHPARGPDALARATHRGLACAASDQDVAGMRRGRNRRSGTEEAYDGSQGQRTRHPAGLSHLTTAGESVYAPVRAGMEAAWVGETSPLAHRDLCG